MGEYSKPKVVGRKDSPSGKKASGHLMLLVEVNKPDKSVPDCGGKKPTPQGKLLLG